MKPRVGVYLSKRTAARLAMAAKRREITKSALVEAAIDRFLASDDTSEAVMLAGRLADLSGQVDQLDRNLGIVSEIVSLHARFHLAVARSCRQRRSLPRAASVQRVSTNSRPRWNGVFSWERP